MNQLGVILITNKTRTSKVGAIPQRLKKRKVLKHAQDVFMKSSENSSETPKGCLSCSKRLRNHFSPTGNKKTFLEKIRIVSIRKMSHSAEKFKRGTLWNLLTYILMQNIKKNRRGYLYETLKNFRQMSHSAAKKN